MTIAVNTTTVAAATAAAVANLFGSNSGVVGFGTAGLGNACYHVVQMALETGFRTFDTAEADWWYDQKAVGRALEDYFTTTLPSERNNQNVDDNEDTASKNTAELVCDSSEQNCWHRRSTCQREQLRVSTKIPPWSLTSFENIRSNAALSRTELVGFCPDQLPIAQQDETSGGDGIDVLSYPYPLDVYYIHAPTCWKGWHPRCENHPPLLDLRSAWLAMEAVVGLDHSAQRIGLSNVQPEELLDIIQFVQSRQQRNTAGGATQIAPPRKPDVVQAYADPIYPAEELRKICQQHGIEFVSYSTLGTQHRTKTGTNPVLSNSVIQQIAHKHERSTAEVALSWALQNGMSIIPRSSQKRHIAELGRLLTHPNGFLDSADLQQIDKVKYTSVS